MERPLTAEHALTNNEERLLAMTMSMSSSNHLEFHHWAQADSKSIAGSQVTSSKRYRVLKQRVANAAAEMLLYLLKVSYR